MRKKKITCGVGIIECLDKDDPGSEGRCLEHVFNLMEIDSAYSHVDSIDELLRSIAESEFQELEPRLKVKKESLPLPPW